MSGGVDSSVAAYILKEQGYDVIGVTLSQIPHTEETDDNEGGCCSISSVFDAKGVADFLDIPHYVMNFRGVFERRVIDYFIDEYMEGRTPNPCLMCNKRVRFSEFLEKAKGLGADYIATGHYAVVEKEDDRYLLRKSADTRKDQTYFLHQMTQYQLAHTLFPLGKFTKDKVREIGEKIGIVTYDKPDSEEICFIPDDDHGKFIKERVDDIKAGDFIDTEGNILGKHKGIVYYTVGQRKGLGLSLGKRVFVKEINPVDNTIVIGDEKDLYNSKLYAEEINLIPFEHLNEPMEVKVKIRYSLNESDATITPHKEGVLVEFKEPQRAITKGQAVVFYSEDVVVGGGIIKEIL